MTRSESCANCHFHEDTDEASTVECRVDPPRPIRVLNDNFPSNARSFPGLWPSIPRTKWCGKWWPMEKPPEATGVRVHATLE